MNNYISHLEKVYFVIFFLPKIMGYCITFTVFTGFSDLKKQYKAVGTDWRASSPLPSFAITSSSPTSSLFKRYWISLSRFW